MIFFLRKMNTSSFYGKERIKIRITDVSGIVESTNTEHYEEISDGTSDVALSRVPHLAQYDYSKF